MAMMTEHTTKAFDADLQELARMIAEMGGFAERQIGDAVDALNRRDTALSQSVIAATSRSTTCNARSRKKPYSPSRAASPWRWTCATS